MAKLQVVVPDKLFASLKARAAADGMLLGRSVEWLLEHALETLPPVRPRKTPPPPPPPGPVPPTPARPAAGVLPRAQLPHLTDEQYEQFERAAKAAIATKAADDDLFTDG